MKRVWAGSGIALLALIAVLNAQSSNPSPPNSAAAPPGGAPPGGAPPANQPEDLPEEDTPIQVGVNLVSVLASVRDKSNVLVPSLNKEDFTLYEDGKAQNIKYFARETDLPLTLGLLIDVSKSQENLISIEKSAASAFFSSVLGKKDMAFLISFGHESELLQDTTGSRKALEQGLDRFRPNFGMGGVTPGPVPTQVSQAGTVLFDAVYLAATDRLASEVGRKAIIVITDGVDTGSKTSQKQAIEYALKSDAAIYSIYYYDPYAYAQVGYYGVGYGGGGGWGVLKQLANETGGRAFEVTKKNTLNDIFNQIQQELRTQYALGFTPAASERDGAFHKIEVKTKNKDYKVQARKGYYAMPLEK